MYGLLEQKWYTLSRRHVEDIRAEITKTLINWHGSKTVTLALDNNNEFKHVINIGTDAQKHGHNMDFVTACVILNPGKGGIVYYCKTRVNHINGLQHKLFTEVALSLELAQGLIEYGMSADAMNIHIDANTNMTWKSGEYHQQLAGMVAGYGIESTLKPSSWVASHVADHVVKNKNLSKKEQRYLKKNRCR